MTDTTKIKAKKFTYFIGIDVSKNKLDYAVMNGKTLLFHQEGKNEPDDILAFVTKLKTLKAFTIAKAVFCMEHTGIYCNHLLNSLKKIKANIVVENSMHIKKSLGLTRGKNDKADSIRIAAYASKNKDELRLWVPRRQVLLDLMNLIAVRNRLLGFSMALNTPLKEETTFIKKRLQNQNKQSCKKSAEAIKADLTGVDLSIEMLIDADEHLKWLKQLITSVPCVGPITAIQIMISTNEFKDIKSPKKFACYAGVAPFKNESGSSTSKAKVSPIANKKMKSLLHLCAIRALRCDAELKAYYIRKTETEGKAKLAVVNAIRCKLILRVFACVNQNRPFIKNYTRPNNPAASELTKSLSLET